MAYPNDLSNVVVFKVHPAIGVARVSRNDDYYVFGSDPGTYKSNGLMKRQAVQFRVFAYGENHIGLGELTPQLMADLGITAVWSASVANRKIARNADVPLSGAELVITATASYDDANGGQLVGSLPTFSEGSAISLGQITSAGLFIPPKGGVFRKEAGLPVPEFAGRHSTAVADSTSDGSVDVRLAKGGQELDVLGACILVAPQDFSPDVDPSASLLDWLRTQLNINPSPTPGNIHNQAARTLDEEALASCTNDFAPGFEASFEEGEVTDVRMLFFRAEQDPRIDPREVRVRYELPQAGTGAVRGQLTSGLCSPWQADFTACTGYWSENLPEEAYLDEALLTEVQVFRKEYVNHSSGASRLTSGDDFERGVDKIGVIRLRNSKLTETERNPGDDIA